MHMLMRPPPVDDVREQLAARWSTWSLSRVTEHVLDLTVVVLATWTVVYHASLLFGITARWAVGIEAVLLGALFLLWLRTQGRAVGSEADGTWYAHNLIVGSSPIEKVLLVVAAGSAAAAAWRFSTVGSWPVIVGLWLTAAISGTIVAVLHLRRTIEPDTEPPSDGPERSRTWLGVTIALAWATGLAWLAVYARRPNPDDLYYVNLSQWVVDKGTFPLRDTIFSDLVYPMSSWPPMASYDAMAGTLALLSGVPAASVVYLIVPPVATFLAVLALWRLLHHWRIGAVGLALSLALVFLLYDGGPGYGAPGTLFLTRIWQGKVILLCLMVPTLLVYALRYVEHPTRRRALWMFAGGTASVGLTTSAMFVVPLIAVAGMAPLALRRPVRALQGFAAMAAYPIAAGVVTLAVDGRSADFFESRKLYRFDPDWFGPEIFRDGPIALIGVAAVLAGAVLLPHVAARVSAGLLALFVGVTFIPGVTEIAFDLVGLGPTLWRVSWIVPIAALVGVLGVRIGSFGNRRVLMSVLMLITAAAIGTTLVRSGLPIWTEATGAVMESRPQWKRAQSSVNAAQRAVDAVNPGDLILGPQKLAVTLAVMTTEAKTVAPRDYFMDYLRDDPSFHYDERLTLVRFANWGFDREDKPEIARALTLLDVDEVCVSSRNRRAMRFLWREGYELATWSGNFRCMTR